MYNDDNLEFSEIERSVTIAGKSMTVLKNLEDFLNLLKNFFFFENGEDLLKIIIAWIRVPVNRTIDLIVLDENEIANFYSKFGKLFSTMNIEIEKFKKERPSRF